MSSDQSLSTELSAILELALAQINPVVGDLTGNADAIIERIDAARDAGAQLVLFPELALSGYPPEDLVLRSDFLEAAQAQLQRIAGRTDGTVAAVGLPLGEGDAVFNALALLADGEIRGFCRKRLLPNYGVFDERRYFAAADDNAVVNIDGIGVGLSICEDVWFDDPVFSGLAAEGAQLVLNASASPFHAGKMRQREEMLVDRVRRFGVPMAYCNLVGGQDELVFDGGSCLIAADGQILARAPQFTESLLRCSIAIAPTKQKTQPPADRIHLPPGRPAPNVINEPLAPRQHEIYNALTTGIRDYIEKNGFPGAIVGVSGGIDSALVLALACDALGPDRVTGVTMPSPYNTPETRQDADELIRRVGCLHHEFTIESLMEGFESTLAPVFAGRGSDATEENIQARIRGILLMALSNKFGSIVLTTGNKSEMAVGYATLYGDMAGGFAPLKDVPKLLVFELSRWRNAQLPTGSRSNADDPIPVGIIERPPSAELRPGQFDEQSLGAYEVLDAVIEQYIEQDHGLDQIVTAGIDRDFARRIIGLIDRAEYKRRQAPPGVKITQRAFGRDRRMPITARRRYS